MRLTKAVIACLALGSIALSALGQPIPVIEASSSEQSKPVADPVFSHTSIAPSMADNPNIELLSMIEQLQQEVQGLRGLVEEQAHQIKKMRLEQRDRYIDLDRRVSGLSQRPVTTNSAIVSISPAVQENEIHESPVEVSSAAVAPAVLNVKAEQASYKQAYSLIGEKKYKDAIAGLKNFLRDYPNGSLAPNAYYWMGELYIVTQDFVQAKNVLEQVVQQYPQHRKVSGATYKLATVYDRLGDSAKAKVLLKEVAARYPDSSVAKLASDYLRAMP